MRENYDYLDRYKKDVGFEKILQSINENLLTAERNLYKELPEEKSTIHVVGAPRSGTTLLSQLISSSMDVGYINNLIAAFWKIPVHGIILSKKLIGLNYSSNYTSDFGKTNSIAEPHEFTYFWSYYLKHKKIAQPSPDHWKEIDWQQLKLVLLNMCDAFGTSIVFKSFDLGWHMQPMLKILPKTLFVFVERNVIDNAWSLLQVRKKYFGTYNEWASFKPLQYEELIHLDPYQQVIAQAYYLTESYKQQLQQIPSSNFLSLSYHDVCSKPADALNKIIEKLEALGIQQNITQTPPLCFKNEKKIDEENFSLLNNAYQKILMRKK